MHGIGTGEPGGLEVLGSEQERRAAVLDERPLAIGSDEHPDPTGPRAADADRPDDHPVGAQRVDQRPPRGIPAHRADQTGP